MREERKLNKALRRDGMETQSDILDELKQRYPQYATKARSRSTAQKKRIAVFSSLAAVAACVAIIVPCAVLLPNEDIGDGNDRYSIYDDDDYSTTVCDYTLREYSQNVGGRVLYFDWYDVVEEYATYHYKCKTDEKILGVKEYLYLGDTDEMIYLVVTETNVYFKSSSFNVNDYINEYTIDGHTVKWKSDRGEVVCMFEESGYRYFIYIQDGQDENRLFELAGELLGKD